MAAKSAIAIRRETVIRRLQAALGDAFIMPTGGKDADLLHVYQLEAIASFLEARAEMPVIRRPVGAGKPRKKAARANVNR